MLHVTKNQLTIGRSTRIPIVSQELARPRRRSPPQRTSQPIGPDGIERGLSPAQPLGELSAGINPFLTYSPYDGRIEAAATEWRQRLAHIPAVEFLKRRYASAIERADDRTAARLRVEIDRLINQPGRDPPRRMSDAAARRVAGATLVQFAHDYDDILGPHL